MKPLNIGKLYCYKKKSHSSHRFLKVYGEYHNETVLNPIKDLSDGDTCCIVEQLPSSHSCSTIVKVALQDGTTGFVLLSTILGSAWSLIELPMESPV